MRVRAFAVPALAATGALALSLPAAAATAAPFAPGDIAVEQVGATGSSTTLGSGGTAVFVDEFTPSGAAVQSIALPTADSGTTHALVESGSAGSDGGLTLSSDGSTLVLPGYDAAPGTASVASSTSVARVVGEVSSAGAVDTSTVLPTGTTSPFYGNNFRGATSTDGSQLWLSGTGTGSTGGVWSVAKGGTTPSQLVASANLRWVSIQGGQLYVSSGASGFYGVNAVGTGTPTSGTQTTSNLGFDNVSGASPYGFLLASEGGATSPNVAYVADSSAGIVKYVNSGGTWAAAGSLTVASLGGGSANSPAGLTGRYDPSTGTTTVYFTTPSTLYSLVDTSGTGTLTATPTSLATAPTNTAFRGVAFASVAAAGTQLGEFPLAAVLPLAGVALVGGLVVARRRMSGGATAA